MSAAVTNEPGKTLGKVLAAELKQEAATTRKIIERLPEDKFDWKPHEKSMSLAQLASHIIEMVGWTRLSVTLEGLDFATMDYKPPSHENTAAMLETFDKSLEDSLSVLGEVPDEDLAKSWYMRNGETLYFEMPRAAVMRTMVLNHIIHHRGQLSVYIRLLGVPVPSIYGPSADEGTM
jgi:uncharacterized damage-inducible protein DinB